ncbi:MAG TPA: MATE family efflux transporter [Thermoanaerobaculia bacterium]|nr:MATE family efflux transporter [Thermoanaerobaculia bacterium]
MATPTDPRSLPRRFLLLTGVNILTNLTVPLAGLVDTALLGHLPDIRFLAGVALASLVFDYLYWSFGFLRMGTTGTTAQAVGRGDGAEVHRVLYRSLVVAAALGATAPPSPPRAWRASSAAPVTAARSTA